MTTDKIHSLRSHSVTAKAARLARRSQPMNATPSAVRRQEAEARGRIAELIAAGLLLIKGYRILARRHRGPFGEIDLIAVRGRRLAFVEVKQRTSLQGATACVGAAQAERMGNAAERWLWSNARYREHRIGLDLIVMGVAMIPRHIPDALHDW